MEKVRLILFVFICTISIVSCEKEEETKNSVKISINNPETVSGTNNKLALSVEGTKARIYWEPNDYIKMINSSNGNVTLQYTGSIQDTSATFNVTDGTMTDGNYIGFRPVTATGNQYNNIVYTAPEYYTIDAADVEGYLTDNLLMYTATKYEHGTDGGATFNPAMSVLEIPLKTQTGEFVIKNIVLTPKYGTGGGSNAFIQSAKLPDVINGLTSLTDITYRDTITYEFSGEGMLVGTTGATVKLIVWSNTAVSNLEGYVISINNGDCNKKVTRSAFLNTKYYQFGDLAIADDIVHPSVGDTIAGGYVFYIFQPGEAGYVTNQTHGLVCTLSNLPEKYQWGCVDTDINASDSAIGTGLTNTIKIVNAGCGGAALACYNLVENGYTDWFLPSIKELIALRENILFSSMEGGGYWSSTEVDEDEAYRIPWSAVGTVTYKIDFLFVRPIRQF